MMEQISHLQSEPQSLISVEGFYVVEAIRDKKKFKENGKTKDFYLIKWQGYSEEYNTWEPCQNLAELDELVRDFQKKRNESKAKDGNKKQKEQNSDKPIPQSIKSFGKWSIQRDKKHKFNQIKAQMQFHRIKKLKKTVSQAISNKKEQNNSNKQEKKFENKKKKTQVIKNSPTQLQIISPLNPPKRTNPFMPIQSTSATDVEKNAVKKYGKIVNHIYKDGLIYYQVEKLNHQAKVVRTQLKTGPVIQNECPIYEYLQKYLIQCEQRNRSIQK